MGLKEKKKEEKKSMLGTGHNELSLIMPFPSILRHQTLGLPRRLGNFCPSPPSPPFAKCARFLSWIGTPDRKAATPNCADYFRN